MEQLGIQSLLRKGSYSINETYEDIKYDGSFSADRITPDWKSETDFRFANNQQNITSNGDTNVYKDDSWSYHNSTGKESWRSLVGRWRRRPSQLQLIIIKNYHLKIEPAVEYDIYPYSESYNRQIRIKYSIPLELVEYYDSTMFFETEEFIARQKLAIALGFNQKWGSANFSLTGKPYFERH